MKHKLPGPYGRHFFLIIVSMGLLTACMQEKDRLDEEVRRLCAKDGGIVVHERVILPPEEFSEHGEIRVIARHLSPSNARFFYDSEVTYLQKGKPEMSRNHFKLYRRVDHKLLGEGVVYMRIGGDFPGPWKESSFICPERGGIKYVSHAVFAKQAVK